MFQSYFSSFEITLLVSAGILYTSSVFLFHYSKKITSAVALLLIATFVLKLFHISLDAYLGTWDEMFHALVAKNLSHDFLKPTLYPDAVLPYNYKNWTGNYIWIHKQPLYMWQMAFFIKLFGAKVWAVRLPDVFCFTFAAYCIYRIGKNLTTQSIGYYAALFFSVNVFFGELAVGNESTDHNDLIFITYVTASIWAFTEYLNNPQNKKWIYIIGLLAGMAVLTKWLVGLLVYSGWFFYEVISSGKEFYKPNKYFNLLKSFIVSVIVFLPWQIYTRIMFPEESKFESEFNNRHLFEPIEGHLGDNWFHVDGISHMYGYMAPLVCVLGFVLLHKYFKSKKYFAVSMFYVVFVFVFFSMAATKMISFTMVASCFFYLAFGAVAYNLSEFLTNINMKVMKPVFIIIIFITAYSSLSIEATQEKHTDWKKTPYFYHIRREQIDWKNSCNQLSQYMPKDGKYVLFNSPDYIQNIRLMFYTDYIGYSGLPDSVAIRTVIEKGYKVAVLDNGNLPGEVFYNKDIKIVSLPKFKVKQIDTVYIKPNNYNFLAVEQDGKAFCNRQEAKQEFVLKTFEDGSCQLYTKDKVNATLGFNLGNIILFNKKEFTLTERFRLEQQGVFYKIFTEDGTPVKVRNGGERLVATNGSEVNDDLFEIIKK